MHVIKVRRIFWDYLTSLETLRGDVRQFIQHLFPESYETGSAPPHHFSNWTEQTSEDQFWPELLQWSLSFDTAMIATLATINQPTGEEPGQRSDALSSLVRSSNSITRTGNGYDAQKRKSSEIASNSPPSAKRTRRQKVAETTSSDLGERTSAIDNVETPTYGSLSVPYCSYPLTEGSSIGANSPQAIMSSQPPSSGQQNLGSSSNLVGSSTSMQQKYIHGHQNSTMLFHQDYCQLSDDQFWSELLQWSLTFDAAMGSTLATIGQTINEEPGQSLDALLFSVRDSHSDTSTRSSYNAQKRKSSEIASNAPPPAKRTRRLKAGETASSGLSENTSATDDVEKSTSGLSSMMYGDYPLAEGSSIVAQALQSMTSNQAPSDKQSATRASSTGTSSAPQEHIRRPPNSFILFRQDYCRNYNIHRAKTQSSFSAGVG